MDRKRVLVVEDETMSAMAMADYLEDLGHEVLELPRDGEEAIALAREKRPDLVLMDVNLPGPMNGLEAARIIAAESSAAIVFITGYSNEAMISKAALLSPAAFIVKPFDFSVLDGILKSLG
jgi:DNA-binding NarL/FixJ family response regulator